MLHHVEVLVKSHDEGLKDEHSPQDVDMSGVHGDSVTTNDIEDGLKHVGDDFSLIAGDRAELDEEVAHVTLKVILVSELLFGAHRPQGV